MPEAAARSAISRRSALRALCSVAVLAVGGCRASDHTAAATGNATFGGTAASAPTGEQRSVSEAVAQRIGADELALIAAYDDAIGAHRELASLLEPLRGDHVKHLLALVPGAPTGGPATSSTPSPKPSVPAETSAPAAPASTQATSFAPASPSASLMLDRLIALEQKAAAARVDDLMSSPGPLARLLASMGGCEAAHAALLQGVAR